MSDHPALPGHDLLSRVDYKIRCIPIALHGDGVAVSGVQRSWSKTADIISWTSMLGVGSTLLTNFMIIIWYAAKLCDGPRNLIPIFMLRLKWSLFWLYKGTHPDRDWNGRLYTHNDPEYVHRLAPLANGYYCVLWGNKGDLEWMNKLHSFPTSGSTRLGPCGLCKSNDTTRPWTDCRIEHAAWMRNLYTHTNWAEAHRNGGLSAPLYELPGVGICNYIPDVMHCKHLGTDSYFFGAVLVFLIHYVLPGTPDQNMDTVWASMKAFYQACLYYYLLRGHGRRNHIL